MANHPAPKPRSEYWDDEPLIIREVHEAIHDGFTGLYDQHGEPLYRPREPIGFDPFRWSRKMPSPNQKTYKTPKAPKKKGKG